MRIEGRSVVVTGAASGIGRATALAFAGRGAGRLHLADVDEPGLAETRAQIEALGRGLDVRPRRVDLADLEDVGRWLAALEADGGYDVLHNNAGVVMGPHAFPDTPPDRLQWIMNINLAAVVLSTQTAARHMRDRGGGVIVNTISRAALSGFHDVLYATTKAGLLMFTRLCERLKTDWNVRVAGLLPGLVDTPALRKTGADGDYAPWMAPILANNEAASPADMAEVVLELVEDDSLPGGGWVIASRVDGRIVREWSHEKQG